MAVKDFDIAEAKRNWLDWADVFAHEGSPIDNPLLTSEARFGRFLQEYGVGRTVRKGTRGELRLRIQKHLHFLDDPTGRRLDEFAAELGIEFGTHEPRRSLRSLLSKVGAFLAPYRFVAWDKFARKGLAKTSVPLFTDYVGYLAEMNKQLDGDVGHEIRRLCDGSSYNFPAFHRRVLDIHFMREGGRYTTRDDVG